MAGESCAADAEWRFKKAVYGKPFGQTEVAKLRTPAIKKWRESLDMTKAGANRMMTTLRAALNLAVEHNRVAATAAQAWRAVKQYPKADGVAKSSSTSTSGGRCWTPPRAACAS